MRAKSKIEKSEIETETETSKNNKSKINMSHCFKQELTSNEVVSSWISNLPSYDHQPCYRMPDKHDKGAPLIN